MATQTDERPTPAGLLLRWFDEQDKPEHLWPTLTPFRNLAEHMAETLPPSPEVVRGLQHLLQARDEFERATIDYYRQQHHI